MDTPGTYRLVVDGNLYSRKGVFNDNLLTSSINTSSVNGYGPTDTNLLTLGNFTKTLNFGSETTNINFVGTNTFNGNSVFTGDIAVNGTFTFGRSFIYPNVQDFKYNASNVSFGYYQNGGTSINIGNQTVPTLNANIYGNNTQLAINNNNNRLEIDSGTSNTLNLDFHSCNAVGSNYDTKISSTGGNSAVAGQGNMNIYANNLYLPSSIGTNNTGTAVTLFTNQTTGGTVTLGTATIDTTIQGNNLNLNGLPNYKFPGGTTSISPSLSNSWYRLGVWTGSQGARLKLIIWGDNQYANSGTPTQGSNSGNEITIYATMLNDFTSTNRNVDITYTINGTSLNTTISQVIFTQNGSNRFSYIIYANFNAYPVAYIMPYTTRDSTYTLANTTETPSTTPSNTNVVMDVFNRSILCNNVSSYKNVSVVNLFNDQTAGGNINMGNSNIGIILNSANTSILGSKVVLPNNISSNSKTTAVNLFTDQGTGGNITIGSTNINTTLISKNLSTPNQISAINTTQNVSLFTDQDSTYIYYGVPRKTINILRGQNTHIAYNTSSETGISPYLEMYSSGEWAGIDFHCSDVTESDYDGRIICYKPTTPGTQQTSNMAIMAGNVGINKTNPTYTLDVNGVVNITGASSAWGSLKVSPDSNEGESSIGFYQNTNNSGATWAVGNNPGSIGSDKFGIASSTYTGVPFVITNTGNVGIKNTAPSYALDVNGTINATSLRFVKNQTKPTRTAGTIYQNTNNGPLFVTVVVNCTATGTQVLNIKCDSSSTPTTTLINNSLYSHSNSFSFIVLPTYYYSVAFPGTIVSWIEWY